MWFKLSQIILRNRIAILVVIGLLTILFGYHAFTGLTTDNRYGNTLPEDAPAQIEYNRFKEMFGENEGVLIFAVETKNLYTEENFLKWKEMGDRISNLDGVKSVFSESDLFTIKNNTKEGKFEAEPIFIDPSFQAKSIEQIHAEVRDMPLYKDILYNDSTNVSLMLINIDEEYLADVDKQDVVFDAEDIANEYQETFGQVHFAGLPHIRVVMGKRVVNEMFIFIGLAISITSLLLYLFFRSFRVVLFCNIVVFTAVIWSLGSIAIMGFEISILMALIPPLMIVIGIPDCVYLLVRFHQEVKGHGNKVLGLSRVISRVGNAIFMTNLTTAMGFSTFIFVNSERLQEFGVASSLNIIGVFVLSICIIPILYSFSSKPKRRHLKHLDKKLALGVTNRIIHHTTTNRNWVYVITVIVIIISIIGATQMKATGNLTSDLPEGDQILEDIHFLEDNFGGVIPFEILINYKKDARKFDKATLEKIEAIQDNLSKDTFFSRSLSIVDFMKLINMSYYGNNPDMYKLIERKDMLRLRDYVDAFQKDMETTKQIHRYRELAEKTDVKYLDSIVLNSPKIAKTLLEYVPKEGDSMEVSPNPSEAEIMDFLSKNRNAEEILYLTDRFFPDITNNAALSSMIDTANTTFRIRTQVLDLGSYEMGEITDRVSTMVDSILNPNQKQVDYYFKQYEEGNINYIDSILDVSNIYLNNLTYILSDGDEEQLFAFDIDPDLIKTYYEKDGFKEALKEAIDSERFENFITGVSVVAAQGTKYLIQNLFSSIIFAVISISLLMALLFGSWKMVLVSMIPNFIPLIITAGVMGFTGVPIKPSTLLVFSIALGISVDDTIHFLSRYRRQLKIQSYDTKQCIVDALYETGMSMFYTSIILLSGFSVFVFSQFGGTQALGLLISLTLLVAMLTNLLVVPSLLFSFEKRIVAAAIENEPLVKIYDEEVDVDLDELEIDPTTGINYKETSEEDITEKEDN